MREICDRYGVLLVSDEVICAFGRLGDMFGCERYDYLPDIITCAKGLTSGYSPLGAVICRDFLAEPFLGHQASFAHGLTFGGHPVSCAVGAAPTSTCSSEKGSSITCRAHEGEFRARDRRTARPPDRGRRARRRLLPGARARGDRDTDAAFTANEREELLRGFLLPRFFASGLIGRADDRGDPVVQLAPPLIAGPEEFDFIEQTLRAVLGEASDRFCG